MIARFTTIRFMLLLTACVAMSLSWIEPSCDPTVVRTGRDLNAAIVGHGFFQVFNPDDCETLYTRTGRFQIDQNGNLCIDADGRLHNLEPAICIPVDCERIAIQADGSVQVFQQFAWIDVGQLCLARFVPSEPFANPAGLNRASDVSGPPMIGVAGNEFGLLQQGWIERPQYQTRSILRALSIAVVVSIVLNQLFLVNVANRSSV